MCNTGLLGRSLTLKKVAHVRLYIDTHPDMPFGSLAQRLWEKDLLEKDIRRSIPARTRTANLPYVDFTLDVHRSKLRPYHMV